MKNVQYYLQITGRVRCFSGMRTFSQGKCVHVECFLKVKNPYGKLMSEAHAAGVSAYLHVVSAYLGLSERANRGIFVTKMYEIILFITLIN